MSESKAAPTSRQKFPAIFRLTWMLVSLQSGISMDCLKDSSDAADVSLPAKRPQLTLSLPKGNKAKCFSSPIKKEKFDEAVQGVVPTNTAYGTQWAVQTWTE